MASVVRFMRLGVLLTGAGDSVLAKARDGQVMRQMLPPDQKEAFTGLCTSLFRLALSVRKWEIMHAWCSANHSPRCFG